MENGRAVILCNLLMCRNNQAVLWGDEAHMREDLYGEMDH